MHYNANWGDWIACGAKYGIERWDQWVENWEIAKSLNLKISAKEGYW